MSNDHSIQTCNYRQRDHFVFLKEDKWRPMNHMSEKDCHKFVEEVSAVGLDLKPYVYGEY